MKKYITPFARPISLTAEASYLYTTSEVPMDPDKPGYFDTKQQGSPIWADDDSDK